VVSVGSLALETGRHVKIFYWEFGEVFG